MSILQVVPRIAPGETGVGDYAQCLAQELEQSHGIRTTFIAARTAPATRPDPGRFAAELRRAAAGQAAIVLHYVGYGYARRGAPLWLPRVLQEARRAAALPLATVFHELFAMGRPWHSSFWLSPLQRVVATRLARASGAIVCNRAASARWLRERAEGVPIHVQPVFSNVGEITEPPAWAQRAPALVLFGRAALKRRVLEDPGRLLAVCRRLGVQEIVNIGEHVALPAEVTAAVRQRDCGVLADADVSRVLSASRYLAFSYFPGYLGKSGVFASAAVHGTVPVGFGIDGDEAEGLQPGLHVWGAADLLAGRFEPDGARSAEALRRWYRGHDRAAHAQTVAHALEGLVRRAA